jgi:predicted metal-dependent enzyme (double-stranded beta helix superfamily)
MATFDPDGFVEACLDALGDSSPLDAVEAVVRETVADPSSFGEAMRLPLDPEDDGVLFRGPGVMIVLAVFPAGFATGLHDHRMPAVIGTWAGYEDNLLYRRTPAGLEHRGTRRLEPRDVLVLGADDIHDVHSPTSTWTAGLHVYLGDLSAASRSSWTTPDSPEMPLDGDEMEQRWLQRATATGLVEPTPTA